MRGKVIASQPATSTIQNCLSHNWCEQKSPLERQQSAKKPLTSFEAAATQSANLQRGKKNLKGGHHKNCDANKNVRHSHLRQLCGQLRWLKRLSICLRLQRASVLSQLKACLSLLLSCKIYSKIWCLVARINIQIRTFRTVLIGSQNPLDVNTELEKIHSCAWN